MSSGNEVGPDLAACRERQANAALAQMTEARQDSEPRCMAFERMGAAVERMADLQAQLDQRWSELRASQAKLEAEKAALMDRNRDKSLRHRRLKLTCSGSHVNVERSMLTGGPLAGTKLASLFSGRWDKLLLRDPADEKRIFLDCDAACFRKLLESISTPPMSNTEGFRKPSVSPELKQALHCTLYHFGLERAFGPQETNMEADYEDVDCGGDWDSPDRESKLASDWELCAAAAKLALVKAIAAHETSAQNFTEEKEWIQQFLAQDPASTAPQVVQIDMFGDRICTLRSTLMLCTESALARQFDDAVWSQHVRFDAGEPSSSDSESDDEDADVVYIQKVSSASATAHLICLLLQRLTGSLRRIPTVSRRLFNNYNS